MDRKTLNKSGKLLLNLCKESSLRILNGRTVGDLQGRYTRTTYNGCSLVDYTLVNNELLRGIGNFKVNDLTNLSDHCLINFSLLACFYVKKHRDNLTPLPGNLYGTKRQLKTTKPI
jgi:hypothetical protein